MKKLTKSLAVLLALLLAFGISASAKGEEVPSDLTSLPELKLGATESGVIESDEYIWYAFYPPDGGYYLFPVTGGYMSTGEGVYDAFSIYALGCGPDGYIKWDDPHYKRGDPYLVRVYAYAGPDAPTQSEAYTVTPKFYEYGEPLKYKTVRGTGLDFVLEGSKYSPEDVDYSYTRDNYFHVYFNDGVYTRVAVGRPSLIEIYAVDGILGVLNEILGWLALVPAIPLLGVFLSFFFAPFSALMTLFTLLPVSIVLIPVGLLFLPFSLIYLVINVF